ncbi:hypothetical protein RP20_CCG023622 [Aedes albopictus]|nr:hypothetical protein RP20_CCG023622 [Aedes albopictus]
MCENVRPRNCCCRRRPKHLNSFAPIWILEPKLHCSTYISNRWMHQVVADEDSEDDSRSKHELMTRKISGLSTGRFRIFVFCEADNPLCMFMAIECIQLY